MKLFVVVKNIGGFARENAPIPKVVGAFTNHTDAQTLRALCHGEVQEIELDSVPPGYFCEAKIFNKNWENAHSTVAA